MESATEMRWFWIVPLIVAAVGIAIEWYYRNKQR